jgi:TRAP-type transport system small permease protein
MRAVIATLRAIETGLRILAALCLGGLFVLMLAQVLLRYSAFGVPSFTEELARYAMVWMALLATAVAVREGSHIRIDFFPQVLGAWSPPLGRMIETVIDAITMAVCVVVLWQGIDIVAFAAGQRSDGLRIPLSWPYAMLPAAFGFATLFALARLVLRERLE